MGEDELVPMWKECINGLKECFKVVVPIGSLSVGLCRHRALLFKVRSQLDAIYGHNTLGISFRMII